MTFASEIEEFAAKHDDVPLLAVIGEFGWGNGWGEEGYHEDDPNIPNIPWASRGVILPWPSVRKWLDYDWDTGYGAPRCHAVTVWCNEWVIATSQYDGSTSLFALPRNPVHHHPIMPGG